MHLGRCRVWVTTRKAQVEHNGLLLSKKADAPRSPQTPPLAASRLSAPAVRAELRDSNDFNGASDKHASFAPLNHQNNASQSDDSQPLPRYVNRRPRRSGGWSYYFNPPTWARRAVGCPVHAEPLGIDHEAAISRAETILLPALDAWRKERGKGGAPSQDCGNEFPIGAHVYFVRLGEIGRCIKIGFSNNLHQRFRAFRAATLEIEPLAFLPGPVKLERRLHSLFAHLHIQNELFHEHYSIHDFIQIARDRSIKAAIRHEQQRQEWVQRAKESEARHQERVAQWIRDRDATHRTPAPAPAPAPAPDKDTTTATVCRCQKVSAVKS